MRGKTKDDTENFSIQDIVENEKARADVSVELASLQELVAVLKQYGEDLKSDESNITKARLNYENAVKWADEQQCRIERLYDNLANKFDELNRRLCTIASDIPENLTIRLGLSASDKLAIQAQFAENVRDMCKQHQKNISEIRQAFDAQMTKEYELLNDHHQRLHDKFKQANGIYISGFWLHVCAAFFLFGICIVVCVIAIYIYKAIAL